MVNIKKLLFSEPKDTGFRFGFIAMLLVGIALIYPSFYNLGYTDPVLLNWTVMLIIGLMMSIMFSVALRNKSRTTIDSDLTPDAVFRQLRVLSIGVISGIVLIVVNIVTKMGITPFDASITNGFFMGLLAGVTEELFFRGFVQNMFRVYAPNMIMAIVPASLVFAFFHFFAYGLSLSALTVIFALGLFLGLLHEIFNDIGVPMIAHIVNNTVAMLPAVITAITSNMMVLMLLVGVFVVSYTIAVMRK